MEALILAGGYGTRLLPITVNKPKHMIKLLGKPILQHIISSLAEQGIKDIIISTNRRFQSISHYFDDGSDFGCEIRYIIENERLGGVKAIKNAAIYSDMKDDFIVVLGDNIISVDYKRLIEFHYKKGSDVTLVLSKVKDCSEYGAVKISSSGRVLDFREKSSNYAGASYASAGIYVFKNSVMESISNEFYDSTGSIFPDLLNKGLKIFGYVNPNKFTDIGKVSSYLEAQTDMLNGKQFLSEKAIFKGELKDGFWIDDNVVVEEGAIVRNSALYGDTVVEKGAVVDGSVVFESRVKSDSTLKSSFLDFGCEIGKGSFVENSVLGENVKLGDYSTLRLAKIYPNLKIIHKSSIQHIEIKTQLQS